MPIYENVAIEEIEYTGHGVGHLPDGRVLFVENTLPGEIVNVRLTKIKKRYAFAYPLEHHAVSPLRVDPFCEHFFHCGGCKWQYVPYDEQVRFKENFVRQIFRRIGGVSEPPVEPTLGCLEDRYYRNKMEFSFTNDRWLTEEEVRSDESIEERRALGLHVRKRYDKVLRINHCYLQGEPSNEIRNAMQAFAVDRGYSFFDPVAKEGYLRGLIIRTSLFEETMVVLVVGRPDADTEAEIVGFLRWKFPGLTSAYATYNATRNDAVARHEAHLLFGAETIRERCGHLALSIHPKSFYQTNPRQAERLYALLAEWAALDGSQIVYDLYCGIGSIALFLAGRADRVVGIETVTEAVANAVANARENGIENCSFEGGAVEQILTQEYAARTGRPDLVVVDPPRAGLKPKVVELLRLIKPPRILYVSCNPSTQARDIAALGPAYALRRIKPVDMFPHTYHIETVAELHSRGRIGE